MRLEHDDRAAVQPSRRAVLRTAFGAMVLLLIFSTLEAYRIQDAISERHLDIYRHYMEREDALSRLRRNVLLSSSYVRDFFLSTREDRAQLLHNRLRELGKQNGDCLERLERLEPKGSHYANPRKLVEDYWRVLTPVGAMLDVTASAAYDFVQREVTPRRSAVYAVLRQLTEVYQNELQVSETEFARGRQTSVRRLALLLGLCVVVGVLVAVFSLRHADALERQVLHQFAVVTQAKHELQELSARILDIQEEERRRLSRGLHDEIGQTLTALRIEISNALHRAAVPEVGERLERARALAERCVQTVRDISLVLRPALLDDLGLAPALQWQVEDFSRRSGIRAELHEEGVEDTLPDLLKTTVYRVVQEALNNCEKHARASRVWVDIRQTAEMLLLEVRDDGRGFEVNDTGMPARGEGLGVLGMRERAARLGGTLVVDSAPGRGTRISLAIPLKGRDRMAAAGGEGA